MKFLLIASGVIAVIFLLTASPAPPKFPRNVQSVQQLEHYLSRLVETRRPPGISIAVVRDGEILYSHSVGVADQSEQKMASQQTVYHWWSMTKVATAVAVMQLHERRQLDLDRPVAAYLSELAGLPGNDLLKQITVRQVMRHTAGLPDMIPAMIGWVHYEDVIYDQMEIFRRLLPKYGKLKFEPDVKSAYSNFGYLMLGAVIESVSGRSYETYVLENVIKPLGMDLTNFVYTPNMSGLEAAGSHPLVSVYTPMLPFLLDMKDLVSTKQGSIYWFNRIYLDVTPSSGLIGSIEDAAKFMLAYIGSEVLLSNSSKSEMLPQGQLTTQRPLGWSEFNLQERLWVQHRGGGPGFATIMRIYPAESLGIVVMANGTNLPGEKIVNALVELFEAQEK